MKKVMTTSVAALICVAFPAVAHAGCAEFTASAGELSLRYDPFNPAALYRVFTLRIRRVDPSVTSVRLLFADPDSTAGIARMGPSENLNYDIRWNTDTGRPMLAHGAEQPNATNGAHIPFGKGLSGDVVHQNFRLSLPAGQGLAAGDYYQPLDVRYICYTGDRALGPPDMQIGAQVALNIRVPEEITTFIGSAGVRRGQIDFGEVKSGTPLAPRSLIVTAQTTIPYDIDVNMEHGGLTRGDRDGYVLPYRLRLSGLRVAGHSRLSCARTDAPNGRRHPLQVELDPRDIAHAPAGDYHDVVTLTFSPRLGLSGESNCSLSGG